MHRGGGTTGYDGEGLYPSLMRAWNPALSLRTTACPVEDSSPRWSNSHALTRDPRGGRHSPGTPLVLVREREEEVEEETPRTSVLVPRSVAPSPSVTHGSPPREIAGDRRDHGDPIAAAGVYVCVKVCGSRKDRRRRIDCRVYTRREFREFRGATDAKYSLRGN